MTKDLGSGREHTSFHRGCKKKLTNLEERLFQHPSLFIKAVVRLGKNIRFIDEFSSAFPPEIWIFHQVSVDIFLSHRNSVLVSVSVSQTPDSGFSNLFGSPKISNQEIFELGKVDIYGLGYVALQLIGDQLYLQGRGVFKLSCKSLYRAHQNQLANRPDTLKLLNEFIIPCLDLDMYKRPIENNGFGKN